MRYRLCPSILVLLSCVAANYASSLNITYIVWRHVTMATFASDESSTIQVSVVSDNVASQLAREAPAFKAVEPILDVVRSNVDFYKSNDEDYSAEITFDESSGKVVSCMTPDSCDQKSFCGSTSDDLNRLRLDSNRLRGISSIQVLVKFKDPDQPARAADTASDTIGTPSKSESRDNRPAARPASSRSETIDVDIGSGRAPAQVQDELKAARTTAYTGMALYCAGSAVEVVGALVFVGSVMDWESSQQDNYYEPTSSTPPLGGLYVAVAGGVVSFAGTIVCNVGGSMAHSGYEAANNTAPPFRGWSYFIGSIVCDLGGTLLSETGIPIVPTALSVAGFVLNLSSVVHSTKYANNVYMKSLVLHNVQVGPMVDSKFRMDGMRISADF